MTQRIECPRVADTLALGRRLASLLQPGDVVLLSGRLGAGKTVFVSGLAEGLGVTGPVTSPSFVLAKTYADGFLPLIHADAYRLGSLGELEDLGLTEQLAESVLVIEWGNAVEAAMGDDHLVVHFTVGDDEARSIELEPRGSWVKRPLQEVAP